MADDDLASEAKLGAETERAGDAGPGAIDIDDLAGEEDPPKRPRRGRAAVRECPQRSGSASGGRHRQGAAQDKCDDFLNVGLPPFVGGALPAELGESAVVV